MAKRGKSGEDSDDDAPDDTDDLEDPLEFEAWRLESWRGRRASGMKGGKPPTTRPRRCGGARCRRRLEELRDEKIGKGKKPERRPSGSSSRSTTIKVLSSWTTTPWPRPAKATCGIGRPMARSSRTSLTGRPPEGHAGQGLWVPGPYKVHAFVGPGHDVRGPRQPDERRLQRRHKADDPLAGNYDRRRGGTRDIDKAFEDGDGSALFNAVHIRRIVGRERRSSPWRDQRQLAAASTSRVCASGASATGGGSAARRRAPPGAVAATAG